MRVKEFSLNSDQEVIVKIVREVLNLFKIQILDASVECTADFEQMSVVNELLPGIPVRVKTTLCVEDRAGTRQRFSRQDAVAGDERESAGIHRLIKLNLYHIFREHFSMPPALWGILHGVRPTKIVHRFIQGGASAEEIISRLKRDYEVSDLKARCITELAFRQLSFLASSDERTVSIYVGIPFCLSRCLYCSFPAYVLPPAKELEHFMNVWKKDLAAAKSAVDRYGLKVQNIYIGGGTPTSLPNEVFAEMLHLVYNAFYGPELFEFTVEAGRPDSMSPEKIKTMVDCHVSRVSVNPQTMQLRTLKRIGRNHTPEDVVQMFHALRTAGIPHINMDLILGLPGESVADVEDTMQKVVALQPDDITLHALALKRGSRLKMNLEDFELPSDIETQRMFNLAMSYVDRLGLKPYYLYRQGYMSGQLENVSCCRKGAESMYNIQIMEEHQTILGIGGAATTKVVNFKEHRMRSAFNAKDLATYLKDVDKYIEKRDLLLEAAYQE